MKIALLPGRYGTTEEINPRYTVTITYTKPDNKRTYMKIVAIELYPDSIIHNIGLYVDGDLSVKVPCLFSKSKICEYTFDNTETVEKINVFSFTVNGKEVVKYKFTQLPDCCEHVNYTYAGGCVCNGKYNPEEALKCPLWETGKCTVTFGYFKS